VSNGSVKVEVANVMPANKKGEFKSVTGFTVYRHVGKDENKDKTVTSFDLLISGASGCSDELTDLTAFTIVTSMGQINVGLRPRGASGTKQDLLFTFGSNVTKPANHILMLSDHKLVSVRGAKPRIKVTQLDQL
jgi:hypothetical protein